MPAADGLGNSQSREAATHVPAELSYRAFLTPQNWAPTQRPFMHLYENGSTELDDHLGQRIIAPTDEGRLSLCPSS